MPPQKLWIPRWQQITRLSTPSFPLFVFCFEPTLCRERKKRQKTKIKSQQDESLTEHDRHCVDLGVERAPPLPRFRPGVDVEDPLLWRWKEEVTCFLVGLVVMRPPVGIFWVSLDGVKNSVRALLLINWSWRTYTSPGYKDFLRPSREIVLLPVAQRTQGTHVNTLRETSGEV